MVNSNNLGKYSERNYTESSEIQKVWANTIVKYCKCENRHYFKVETIDRIH